MSAHLMHGDCIQMMRLLGEASVDAVVTDPPYGIRFMGKAWDGADIEAKVEARRTGAPLSADRKQGATGAHNSAAAEAGKYDRSLSANQAFEVWTEEWAREALRVLKPGGHLLSFSSPRTYHRMASGIEDAGFEIRDQIMWLFGCLSEDTEILVDGRWEPYQKATSGRLALCYDVEHDSYTWQPIQALHEYPYSDTAFRIVSDQTDQIVSRNHRCLVEQGRGFAFQIAETLEREARVPVLEDVQALLRSIPLLQQGTSSQEQDMQQSMHAASAQRPTSKEADAPAGRYAGADLQEVQEAHLEAEGVVEPRQGHLLQQVMQSQGSCAAPDPLLRSCQGEEEARNRIGREQKPSMERRSNRFQEARQLLRGEVCPVPEGVPGNGARGWIHHGASTGGGASNGEAPEESGGGSSHESRSDRQQDRKSSTVHEQRGAQVVRASRFTSSSLARVVPFAYSGIVWCVTVPTGAFVARRNGKVFVTGNSGFPKNLNISKAIDAKAGVESEEVPTGPPKRRMVPGRDQETSGSWVKPDGLDFTPHISVPVTDEAKQWAGFGTALKPAHEPCVLARKPLIGTVVQNVLAHGCGGLNIDGCRVELTGATDPRLGGKGQWGTSSMAKACYGKFEGAVVGSSARGRFPANVITDGSDEVRACFPDAPGQQGKVTGDEPTANGFSGAVKYSGMLGRIASAEPRDEQDTNAIRFFYQAKAAAKDRRGSKHPTVKPIALMRYLCRLVTPPGGLILDPFAGSGTTGEAAHLEGFRAILIEREDEYVADIRNRLQEIGA